MKEEIEKAREIIDDGRTVVFPTETAYGIAVDALNEEAVEKVYEAKQRPKSKPLTVICHDLDQVEEHAELTAEERKLVEEFMPGPLTLIVEKKPHVPDNLNESFVFRIPGSETARKLARNGPITATSANISGKETSYSVGDISEKLKEKTDYIIDRGMLEQAPTSTIIEIVGGEPVLHREGPIKKEEIQKVLQG